MTTISPFEFFIIAAVVAIVSSLLGVVYEMHKSKAYYFPEHSKTCVHGFKISEVMDLKTDPKCAKCGKKLSELKLENNQ